MSQTPVGPFVAPGAFPARSLLCLAASCIGAALPGQTAAIGARELAPYNVVWDSPSLDSSGSMPLGNGETGVNLWVERATGDVVLYLARGDAWTENTVLYRGDYGLAKVGRIRLKVDNGAFLRPTRFRQEFDLASGSVTVEADGTKLRAWADANRGLIHLEFSAERPFRLRAEIDTYRKEELRGTLKFQKVLWSDTLKPAEGDAALILSPDILLRPGAAQVGWCYRNRNPYHIPELENWTFGALLRSSALRSVGASALESTAPASAQRVEIATFAFAAESVENWQREAERRLAAIPADDSAAWDAHVAWWHAFWNRSYIFVEGDADAFALTRGYLLARQLQAFQGRGAYPIKFNGGLFNFDNRRRVRSLATGEFEVRDVNGDYREWGGHYWFQNTRPMYWPMMAAGDFDLMQPFFRMYRDILRRNEQDVRAHYGHAGAYLAETTPFTGGLPKVSAADEGNYTLHYYTPVLELGVMMLDYFDHTRDEAFARDYLVPMMTSGLAFFREHFPRDDRGRLRIEPANSAETFWKTRNPATDVAGLHYVLPRMLELPDACVTPETKATWREMLRLLPDIPMVREGDTMRLLPFEFAADGRTRNQENPELYSIYPFRIFTLGHGLERAQIGRRNFEWRQFKRAGCWYQDPIQAALVGATDSAAKDTLHALTNRDPGSRFPAFWDAGNDYTPDFDNGGNGMHALQLMLLQPVGKSLLIAPAWPARWSARFRLHAPDRTVVEGVVVNGAPAELAFFPTHRRADAVMPNGAPLPTDGPRPPRRGPATPPSG